MRPVLFEIPLPALALPLGLTLALVAVLAAAVAVLGYGRRAPDLLLFGAAGALASLVGAIALRGHTYTPGPIPVMSYGLLLSLSLALGWVLTLRLAERGGMRRDVAANAYVFAAVGGIVGARLLYAATNPGEFQRLIDVVALSSGGLAAYGGFLGGLLGALWALKRLGASFSVWADAAAPSVALGLGLTRIGCYLHGCDFGRLLTGNGRLAQLGTFPRWSDGTFAGAGSPAWIDHVLRKGLSPAAPQSLPVHPTQLYESLVGLALFAGAVLYYRRRRFAGELFLLLSFGYGACRFVLELFRDDAERGLFGPKLPGAAWIAIGLLAIAGALVAGPLSIRGGTRRERTAVAVAAAAGFATLGLVLARFTAFGHERGIALSTSQWLALATVLAVAFVIRAHGGQELARQPALGSSS